MQTEQILIELLRSFIAQTPYAAEVSAELDEEALVKIYCLARIHSVVPLVAETLFNNRLLENKRCKELYRKKSFEALMQHQQQITVLQRLQNLFEENHICYVPLKGTVIRGYYPQPWLRTSCDIDVLIKPKDVDRAVELLKKSKFEYIKEGSHDVSFTAENGTYLELHYNTIEENYQIAQVHKVLCDVWDYCTPKRENSFEYEMSDEMFYFYHIAHMAKHFAQGGCGIRGFLDIYFLKNALKLNEEKMNELFEKAGILTFAQMSEKLSDIWFLCGDANDITDAMQEFIFRGGAYGSLENQIAVNQVKAGNSKKSILKKVFIDYDVMKFRYPILQKYKFLLPFYQVLRWCKLIFKKEDRERSLRHIYINSEVSEKTIKTTVDLLEKLGI